MNKCPFCGFENLVLIGSLGRYQFLKCELIKRKPHLVRKFNKEREYGCGIKIRKHVDKETFLVI